MSLLLAVSFTGLDKHTGLLHQGINYDPKMFYDIGPRLARLAKDKRSSLFVYNAGDRENMMSSWPGKLVLQVGEISWEGLDDAGVDVADNALVGGAKVLRAWKQSPNC